MMRDELKETAVAPYSIHPVPNNGVFHLLGALEQGMRVQIIDFNGRLVFTKTLEIFTQELKVFSEKNVSLYEDVRLLHFNIESFKDQFYSSKIQSYTLSKIKEKLNSLGLS